MRLSGKQAGNAGKGPETISSEMPAGRACAEPTGKINYHFVSFVIYIYAWFVGNRVGYAVIKK